MVEQRPVKSEVVGSSPANIAKTRWLKGLKQQIANLFFAGSNPVLVSNYGSIEQLVGSPDCKSGLFGACRFESYYFHNVIYLKNSHCDENIVP